jgi:ABC-type transport system involved in multi-copper enzyme maturation permease subunit
MSGANLFGRSRITGSVRSVNVLDVLAWELRRLRASRSSWAFAAAAFGFCVALIALKHSWGRPVVDGVTGESIEILGTTSVGVLYMMIAGVLTLFALFLPFVATDAVAHDYRQRVHELVMATPVSSGAYVWGRYLACLLASIGLDMLLLAAVLLMGSSLHAGQASYPVPDVWLVLGVWALAILPATVVVTSLSFALGTLLPRLAVFAKLLVLLGWISLVFLADVLDHGGTWFTYWNPTSYGIVRVHVDQLPPGVSRECGGCH